MAGRGWGLLTREDEGVSVKRGGAKSQLGSVGVHDYLILSEFGLGRCEDIGARGMRKVGGNVPYSGVGGRAVTHSRRQDQGRV